jgi:hypothetical protein
MVYNVDIHGLPISQSLGFWMQFLWIKDTETIKIEEILISRVFYILNIRSKIIIKTLLIFVSVFTPLLKCV